MHDDKGKLDGSPGLAELGNDEVEQVEGGAGALASTVAAPARGYSIVWSDILVSSLIAPGK